MPTSTMAQQDADDDGHLPYLSPHDPGPDAYSYNRLSVGSSSRINLDFRPLLSVPLMRTAHPHVRQAMSWVDYGSVLAGRWLTSRPTLRLGALTYVVILHLLMFALLTLGRRCGGPLRTLP